MSGCAVDERMVRVVALVADALIVWCVDAWMYNVVAARCARDALLVERAVPGCVVAEAMVRVDMLVAELPSPRCAFVLCC